MKTSEIIERFIDLAQEYDRSKTTTPLTEDEVRILFALVFVAGFRPLLVNHMPVASLCPSSIERTSSADSFQINTPASYIVICADGQRGLLATKWLCSALRFAAKQTDRRTCRALIQCEIEKDLKLKDFFEH